MEDIRWKQRFTNYTKALNRLDEAVVLLQTRPLSYLEKQGLIQAFEFTFELSWKVLKDFLSYQGTDQPLYGSRDTIKTAFNVGLIDEGESWLKMLKSRNLTSHIYDEQVIDDIIREIETKYLTLFTDLQKKLDAKV